MNRIVRRPDLRRAWLSRLSSDQFDGLKRLVEKAKSAVRQARFKRGNNRHLQTVQNLSIMRAETAQERTRGHER